MREFFADSDFTTGPQVSSTEQKGYVPNDVGLCLMAQGRLTEALPLLERSIIAATASNDWEAAASGGASATRRGARIYRAIPHSDSLFRLAFEALSAYEPNTKSLYDLWGRVARQTPATHRPAGGNTAHNRRERSSHSR